MNYTHSIHRRLTQGYPWPKQPLDLFYTCRNFYPPCHSHHGVVLSPKPWYRASEEWWDGRGKHGKKGSKDVRMWCVVRGKGAVQGVWRKNRAVGVHHERDEKCVGGYRLARIEAQKPPQSMASQQQPPFASTAAKSGPSPIHGTTNASSQLSRCTKCHARGHTVENCRTADPSAMRICVAG